MRLALVTFVICCFTQDTSAAEFRLKDGSIVYGDIVKLEDGKDIFVDTEHMGEIKIEWNSIASIIGTQVVKVELFTGRRMLGTVTLDESGVSITGRDMLTVDPNDIFEISEVSETFRDGLEAYTDLGMNLVRGNNRVTQVSFGGGVGYETSDIATAASATTIINEQSATEDTRRLTANANFTRKFDGGWQASGSYQFESDEQQNLDGRSLFGATLERRVVNQRQHRFLVFGGLALNSEDFANTPRNDTLEGVVGARYRLRTTADADLELTVYPNLEDSGRVRAELDGNVSFDLFSDLDFKITAYDRYDSQPPPGNKKNDTGVTLGLSWEY